MPRPADEVPPGPGPVPAQPTTLIPAVRQSRPATAYRSVRELGPIRIAIVIAAALTAFGVGAAVLSPLLASRPATGAPGASWSPQPAPATTAPAPGPPASPSPSPSPSASATVPGGNAAFEDEVVELVNAERAKRDCAPLRNDERLRTAARWHSTDLAATADRNRRNAVGHEGSDGSSPSERMRRAGYAAPMSENVAYGHRSPKEAVRAWMRSKGHRANMLDCDARAIGVGVAYRRSGTPYWTQRL